MNPNEYQRLAMRTKCSQVDALYRIAHLEGCALTPIENNPGVIVQLNHAALGLCGDAGELANAVARHIYYGKELDVTNVKEEIGDCLWWLAEACDAIGVTMEEMMEANIRKLQQRYPDKYTNEHAAEENRDREAERKAIERDVKLDQMYIAGRCIVCGKQPLLGQLLVCCSCAIQVNGYPSNPQFLCPNCKGILALHQVRRLPTSWAAGRIEKCPNCMRDIQRVEGSKS